jgi:hypothetical protein
MAQVPIIIPRVPLEAPNIMVDRSGVNDAANRAFRAFNDLQESSARTGATRSVAEGAAEVAAITQHNADTIADPTAFTQKNIADIEAAYNARLQRSSSPRERQLIEAGLSDEMIRARGKTAHTAIVKTRDKRDADFIIAEDLLRKKAVGGTPAQLAEANAEYSKMLAGEVFHQSMTEKEAAAAKVRFNDRINNDTMNLKAQIDPAAFTESYLRGDFAKNDPMAVDKALDIAAKTSDMRARKDKLVMEERSRTEYRKFEEQASKRELDLVEFNKHAKYYEWSKDKVDALINMQIGIKAANPYEKQLVETAMTPADANARYTMTDIMTAEANLKRLAQNRQVSTETEEYRSAMRRLQGMVRGLEMTGDVKEKTSEFDARQRVTDLYNQYVPDQRDERIKSEKAAHMNTLQNLDPAARRSYTDKLERDFETKATKSKQPRQIIEGLRGTLQPGK